MNKLALALAGLVLAGTAYAQTAATTTTAVPTSTAAGATRLDTPGVLGNSFVDFNYSWVDFHEDRIDADGFIAGVSGNTPVAPGLDVGLGYSYFRENNHRNPFNNSSFDARSHLLATSATLYGQGPGLKPFVSAAVGYQWSRGDLQSFRTYDDQWVWGASVGAEFPLGRFALTPRISYSNTFDDGTDGGEWSYGGEAHHWFTERVGGYLDATFHEPRARFAPDYWTYTAGVRLRF